MLMARVGPVLGFGGAFGLTGLLANLLFGIGERDPMTIIGVSGILTCVPLLACYISGAASDQGRLYGCPPLRMNVRRDKEQLFSCP